MVILVLVVEFHLVGCRSLKEKRHRLSGLRERFGKQSNVAVCESAWQDLHQQAQWTFVGVGVSRRLVEQTLAAIELALADSVDAVITRRDCREAGCLSG